ncbi:MAG: hypothetical protein JO267_03080 [Alphaproteobacteria bacterium]|nr:hypothetical protein [Alphaproteobacteria bacterium]
MIETAEEAAELPLYTIELDRTAFGLLRVADRETFWHSVRRLEELEYSVRHGRPRKEWAFVDLDEYATFEEFKTACRKVHKGAALRHAAKAERNGYYCKFFHPQVFVGDIVAVNTSTPERQGGTMSDHYRLTVDERGGFAKSVLPEVPPSQPVTWRRHWGIFRRNPGHRQGDLIVDEELIGYLILSRCAEFAIYSTFLGHWDYLPKGVTYKMHMDLVQTILHYRNTRGSAAETDRSLDGLRYLFYARYFNQGEGLLKWKKRMLFRPGHFEFDYPEPPSPPRPLMTVSAYEARGDADYAASGFAPDTDTGTIKLVLYNGTRNLPNDGEFCNLWYGLTRRAWWSPLSGVLIGGSITGYYHSLLTEALADACRGLAPGATVFSGTCDNPILLASRPSRDLAQWLLRRSEKTEDPQDALTSQLLTFLMSHGARQALGLDTVLSHIAPQRPLADIAAVGGSVAAVMFFLLGQRSLEHRVTLTAVEYLADIHPQLRDLYRPPEQTHKGLSLSLVADISALKLLENSLDLVVFEPEIWRIRKTEWTAIFCKVWAALRAGGVLILNPTVRPDGSDDGQESGPAHIPTRREVVELMTFAQPPELYRAVNAWSTAEDPFAVAAVDYLTESYLVARKFAEPA